MYSFKGIISQILNLYVYFSPKCIYLRLKLILCHLSLYFSYFTKEKPMFRNPQSYYHALFRVSKPLGNQQRNTLRVYNSLGSDSKAK